MSNMAGYTITTSLKLVTTSCADCGVVFAVPDYFDRERRQTGARFYCPAGHRLVYSSENAELQRKIRNLQACNTHLADQREAAEHRADIARRQASAFKGQVTKIRKRVGNGVCPGCNRTFANVARHMASQHPDYSETEVQT